MADQAGIHFEELATIVRIYQDRARQVFGEIAPAVAEAMHAQVLEEFETEGRGRWEPFAWQRDGKPKPKGRRWRGNPKLLQDRGVMVGSMTPDWNEGVVEVYSNNPYVKYHASRAPRSKIPLRDPFDIDVQAFEGDVAGMMLVRLVRQPVAAE
jgi:phage gpG-like protein